MMFIYVFPLSHSTISHPEIEFLVSWIWQWYSNWCERSNAVESLGCFEQMCWDPSVSLGERWRGVVHLVSRRCVCSSDTSRDGKICTMRWGNGAFLLVIDVSHSLLSCTADVSIVMLYRSVNMDALFLPKQSWVWIWMTHCLYKLLFKSMVERSLLCSWLL